jgi:hypothetical protein
MEIYFAGEFPFDVGGDDFFGIKHYLASYADLKIRGAMARFLNYFDTRYNRIDLFLDSGAFSAMTVGEKLNLHEYISFVNRYGYLFKVIAALDVIHEPERTWQNYLDMKSHTKYRVIPTFHFREPWEYLERYAVSTDYMAIGGMTDITKLEEIEFTLDVVKRARKLNPALKFHVFGLGRMPTIKRIGHAVDSVDTTDWLYPIKYGNIRNRPKMTKNELNRNQLQRFLRHECMIFQKLENNINEFNYRRLNEEIKQTAT